MKLFTIGPVELYQSTKEVRLNGFVHFRTDEYSEIVNNFLKKLSLMLGNNEPNSLIYLAASGTAAMEATVEIVLMTMINVWLNKNDYKKENRASVLKTLNILEKSSASRIYENLVQDLQKNKGILK